MAILSNINGKFAVDSTGAVQFSGAAGTSGYILKSNGTGSAPTWVDPDTIIGPYLPLSGGTLTGATATDTGISFTVGGVLTGTSATFTGDITSKGLTVDYTGNRTGDAGILVTNDNDDWGIKVDKDGTTDYGILSQTDGENAIVVRNAAGTTNIQLQGDGDATFAGNVTGGNATFTNLTISATEKLRFDGSGGHTYIEEDSNDTLIFATGGTTRLTLDANATFSGKIFIPQSAGNLQGNGYPGTTYLGSTTNATTTYIQAGSTAKTEIELSGGDVNSNIIFKTPNSSNTTVTALTIDTNQNATFAGNVGIGGAPGQNLDIQKSGARFRMIDGTNQFNMGLWDGSNYRFEGDANRPIYMTSYEGNINFGISGGTTMTIQSGKVGIGITSPSANLHVQDASTATLKVITTGVADASVNIQGYDAGVHIGDATNGLRWAIWNDGPSTSSSLKFGSYALGTWYSNSSQVVTMTSDGKVGIGTTSPSSKLHVENANAAIVYVKSTVNNQNASIWFNSNSGGTQADRWEIGTNISAGTDLEFFDRLNSVSRMVIQNDGNVGIGTISPTAKLEIVGSNGTNIFRGNFAGSADIFMGFDNANPYLTLQDNSNITTHLFQSNVNNYIIGSNVGIGTTSPSKALHVVGANPTIRVEANTNNWAALEVQSADTQSTYVFFRDSGGERARIQTTSSNDLRLYTGGGGVLGISQNSSGKVGIGTTSPGRMLGVNGGSTQDGGIQLETTATASNFWSGIEMKTPNATSFIFTSSGDSTGTIKFLPASSLKASLNASSFTHAGDIIAYGSPSDIRLKENIKPIKNPLGKIKKLKGITFDWKKSESILDIKEDYGFIAQDVQKVIPELVRKNENELLSMRHQGVIPILVEAIKELEARVKELENK